MVNRSGASPARRRSRGVRLAILAGLLTGMASTFTPPGAAAQEVSEYELKAAFVYNFAKFVEWPNDAFSGPGDPFVLCVLGDDPFGSTLERSLAGKTVRDRRLVTRRFAGLVDLGRCHILFVAASEERRVGAILQTVARQSVLTVGETDEFAERGGMIGFLMEGSKLRFAVNLDAAEQANLPISSQLLKLATRVLRHEE